MPDLKCKLVLGTAQLGFVYGAANRGGLPSEQAAIDIIDSAVRNGIQTIDTARAYGASEARIRLATSVSDLPPVTVITKLDPLSDIPPNASVETVKAAVFRSLAASRKALGRDRLDVVLLHQPSHRVERGGSIWQTLIEERDRGMIDRLGVSVQTPQEACAALADYDVAHVQLPLNLLDRRWAALEFIAVRNARSDVTFHARSALLQGLLAGTSDARWPRFSGWSPLTLLDDLDRMARSFGREDNIDFCMAWIRAQDWIDGVVVGMETHAQLIANLRYFKNPPLSADERTIVDRFNFDFPADLIYPPRWPKHRIPLSNWRDVAR